MDLGLHTDIQAQAAGRAFDAQLAGARSEAAGGDVDKAAFAFEKLLATMLVKEMNRTLPEGFFGGGVGSDTFNGWLEEHLGGALAETRALGIAESVRASILQQRQAAELTEDAA